MNNVHIGILAGHLGRVKLALTARQAVPANAQIAGPGSSAGCCTVRNSSTGVQSFFAIPDGCRSSEEGVVKVIKSRIPGHPTPMARARNDITRKSILRLAGCGVAGEVPGYMSNANE